MGGFGSTRWGWRVTRLTTDGWLALDVRALARAGALQPGTQSNWCWMRDKTEIAAIRLTPQTDAVLVEYRIQRVPDADSDTIREVFRLDATPCQFGGSRPWFRCPGCETRRAVLYGVHGLFRCRVCHDLAYVSTRVKPAMRP